MTDGHFDRITEALSVDLPAPRFRHVIGVLHTASVLAHANGADLDKVQSAALLHDCAKNMGRDQLIDYIGAHSLEVAPEDFDFPAILHGPVGAHVAQSRFGLEDPEVIDAIKYHPTGKANPSLTLQILMAADFTEPTRDYPGIEDVRQAIGADLTTGLKTVLQRKIDHLKASGKAVHPRAVEMMNSLERTH